ncbi:hypothetical protein N8878_02705 [Psychromonas sp.]|nr:hypothetical protein [Psychromonas sp.]
MIFIVILLLSTSLLVFLHHYKTHSQKILQRQGLVNISNFKSLITYIQSHRGLSSAWLNGDDSKKGPLFNLEKKIQDQIKSIEQETNIIKNERWISFSDHWGRLNNTESNREAENNFTQHTLIVANLLYLLEDEAERSHLNAVFLPMFPNIGFVWRELMVTTEMIGQSRAIGTAIATTKECTSVHKIRLSFLQLNMQKTLNETLPKLSVLDGFSVQHNALLNIAKSNIKFLNKVIETDLIGPGKVCINQDEYFALATDCIAALNNIFDHQIEQIAKAI